MTLGAFHREFGFGVHSDGVSPTGLISGADRSSVQAYRFSFQQLAAGDVKIENPNVTLIEDETKRLHRATDLGSRDTGLPELILGMSELAELHLYISYADKRLYIARSGPVQ